MGSLKGHTSLFRNPWGTRGGGGEYEDCKRLYSTSISDGVDYKTDTKSADTELLFIVHAQQT